MMPISNNEKLEVELMKMWSKGILDSKNLMIKTLEDTIGQVGDVNINLSQIVDLIKELDFEKLTKSGEK